MNLTKPQVELFGILLDNFSQMIELEPDEQELVEKLYLIRNKLRNNGHCEISCD